MPKRKSALDHLNAGRIPHIVHMIPKGAPGYAEARGGAMVVSSPSEVNEIIRKIKPGEVITLNDLRAVLAVIGIMLRLLVPSRRRFSPIWLRVRLKNCASVMCLLPS
jgi:hypothetical protein